MTTLLVFYAVLRSVPLIILCFLVESELADAVRDLKREAAEGVAKTQAGSINTESELNGFLRGLISNADVSELPVQTRQLPVEVPKLPVQTRHLPEYIAETIDLPLKRLLRILNLNQKRRSNEDDDSLDADTLELFSNLNIQITEIPEIQIPDLPVEPLNPPIHVVNMMLKNVLGQYPLLEEVMLELSDLLMESLKQLPDLFEDKRSLSDYPLLEETFKELKTIIMNHIPDIDLSFDLREKRVLENFPALHKILNELENIAATLASMGIERVMQEISTANLKRQTGDVPLETKLPVVTQLAIEAKAYTNDLLEHFQSLINAEISQMQQMLNNFDPQQMLKNVDFEELFEGHPMLQDIVEKFHSLGGDFKRAANDNLMNLAMLMHLMKEYPTLTELAEEINRFVHDMEGFGDVVKAIVANMSE